MCVLFKKAFAQIPIEKNRHFRWLSKMKNDFKTLCGDLHWLGDSELQFWIKRFFEQSGLNLFLILSQYHHLLRYLSSVINLLFNICPKFNQRFAAKNFGAYCLTSLTLAELHVGVLRSFIKFTKLLQNLMKLLPNHLMVW